MLPFYSFAATSNRPNYDKFGRDIFDTFEMAMSSVEGITNGLPSLESYKATSISTLRSSYMLEFCLKAIKVFFVEKTRDKSLS